MTDKINFLEIARQNGNETLPLEREKIISELSEIPDDVVQDYVWGTHLLIENMLTIKTIVAASKKPHLVKHLVDNLNDELLANLRDVILYLKCDKREEKIKEIVNASFGISMPSPEKEKMVSELLSFVRLLYVDHERESNVLAEIACYTRKLSALMGVCTRKECSEHLRWRLSILSENELIWMLAIARNRYESNDMAN